MSDKAITSRNIKSFSSYHVEAKDKNDIAFTLYGYKLFLFV